MKIIPTLITLCIAVQFASAQKPDTLNYDAMTKLYDNGQSLVAATRFPGEVEVLFNMRFTPAKPCSLTGVIVGFGVVKFQPFSGRDTLVVLVYDAQENTQPFFKNVVKTYKVNLGDKGFPTGNIEEFNPLSASARDLLFVSFDPPVLISPKRDMILAFKLISAQKMRVGDGEWSGLSFLMKYQIADPDYLRFRRYRIGTDISGTKNELATSNGNVGIWMRPVVKYDDKIPPTILTNATEIEQLPTASSLTAFPNPFGERSASATQATSLRYTIPDRGPASLRIIDVLGREVAHFAHGETGAGTYAATWDATGLPAGIYFAQLEFRAHIINTQKLVLMK